MKLAHVSAVCCSKDNSDRFYKGVLGLEEIKEFSINPDLTEQIFGVTCCCTIILYGNSDFTVEVFIPESGKYQHNPFSHNCIEVNDKDKFLEACQDAGANVNLVLKGDKTLSFVTDFDGNLFEIK